VVELARTQPVEQDEHLRAIRVVVVAVVDEACVRSGAGEATFEFGAEVDEAVPLVARGDGSAHGGTVPERGWSRWVDHG
jgi:hypothetical protein